MRNIILSSLRLVGNSSSMTIARIVLDTWVDHQQVQRYNQLLILLSADEVCSQLAAEGKSLILTFILCQCFAVHLSDWSTIWKWIKLYLDFPFLFFFYFFLNDLLLVNETSCFLGKKRIGCDFQPNVYVFASACQHNTPLKFVHGSGHRKLTAGSGPETLHLSGLSVCDLEFKFWGYLLGCYKDTWK